MEEHTHEQYEKGRDARVWNYLALALSGVILVSSAGAAGYLWAVRAEQSLRANEIAIDEKEILPPEGVALPVRWGDLGRRLVDAGVIDREGFLALYEDRGGMNQEELRLLDDANNGSLTITPHNSGVLLNLLWAFGLGNRNEILEQGPMQDEQYGGAGKFASTGGWSLATGDSMDHYSRHPFITLTPEQQERVVRVSKGIYRPCCNNPTHFPDCNHGMAMLGLLELLAAQDISEEDMYQYALQVNAYWFPSTYLTIAKYFANEGVAWDDIDAKTALGYDFSSASGYRNILSKVEPAGGQGGGSCGV